MKDFVRQQCRQGFHLSDAVAAGGSGVIIGAEPYAEFSCHPYVKVPFHILTPAPFATKRSDNSRFLVMVCGACCGGTLRSLQGARLGVFVVTHKVCVCVCVFVVACCSDLSSLSILSSLST